MKFTDAAKLTENGAREYLEGIRWPDGPVCPHCGNGEKVYRLRRIRRKRQWDGLYKCAGCRKQFTVTVGTIMHRSHIPLSKWVLAFHLICSSKKGISALQLYRNLDLGSYRTAWHMAHRIRLAMREEPLASMLKGTVEVDETYIGGKSREGIPGRGSERKTPVMALVERGGRMRSHPVERVDAKHLRAAVRAVVAPTAFVITDDWPGYKGLGRDFPAGHLIIRHGKGVYSRRGVHVNTAEAYFAILKRGVHGTFHHVSKPHLERYCDEFTFRWNYRDVSDGERAEAAMRGIEGKRLTYKPPVNGGGGHA